MKRILFNAVWVVSATVAVVACLAYCCGTEYQAAAGGYGLVAAVVNLICMAIDANNDD